MTDIQAVLNRDRRAVAKAISLAEAGGEGARALMRDIHKHTGKAHVVGLTGVPGSGKSTMVRSMAHAIRASGRSVGIVAIDPSSPFSGGAILGDRVRMTGLSGDDGVFIRSLATRGLLGGLGRGALEAVDVLDAAGFDVVLVETVGVGQDEVDIVTASHTVVVVSAPGLGDEVQAIKAGVLEIADIHAVSKCDKPESRKTIGDLKAMLQLGRVGKGSGAWDVPVLSTSSEKGEGIDALMAAIDAHHTHLTDSGEMAARRRSILEMRVLKAAEDIVRQRLLSDKDGKLAGLIDEVSAHALAPIEAAERLLNET